MAENKLGIENLKIVLTPAIGIGNKVAKAMSDNHMSLFEGASILFSEFGDIKKAVKSLKEAKAEYLDLVPEEKQQIHDFVASELDLPGDDSRVELLIEASLDIVIGIGTFVTLLGKPQP